MDKYFIAEFKLDSTFYYMLWKDEHFWVVGGGPVIFKSIKELKYYTAKNALEAVDSDGIFDLDGILSLTSKTNESINCHKLLDCWNILSDLAKTVGEDFLGDEETQANEAVYSMLVLGTNIPELYSEEEGEFHPELGGEVKEHLENVLKNGIEIFRKVIADQI